MKKAIVSPLFVLYASRMLPCEFERLAGGYKGQGLRFDTPNFGKSDMSYWRYPMIFNYEIKGPAYWNVTSDFDFRNPKWLSSRGY